MTYRGLSSPAGCYRASGTEKQATSKPARNVTVRFFPANALSSFVGLVEKLLAKRRGNPGRK
jgi:hypothetical protein